MPLQFTYTGKGQFDFWWNKTKQMELSLIEWYSPLNLPLGLVKKFILETVSVEEVCPEPLRYALEYA